MFSAMFSAASGEKGYAVRTSKLILLCTKPTTIISTTICGAKSVMYHMDSTKTYHTNTQNI